MFADERSDFSAYLKLWAFLEENRRHLTRRKFERLCRQHFLSPTRVREWHDVQVQLRVQMHELGYRDNEEGRRLCHAASGAADRSAQSYRYARPRARHAIIWARATAISSSFPVPGLFAKAPKWLMAAELVETTRLYARGVAAIEPEWVEPLARHLLKHSYSSPRWQGRRGQVAADEKVTLYRAADRAATQGQLWPDRPGGVACDLHPPWPDRGRYEHARAVLAPQSRADRRTAGYGGQVPAARHAGR